MAADRLREGEQSERVAKYHGLGNDFLILDRRASGRDLSEGTVRELCDRRRGIGADGVLVLLPSRSGLARMVVHNADGSVAEMCGNGIRCVVKYLAESSGNAPPELRLETDAGLMSCAIQYQDGQVSEVQVAMGPARLIAESLPSHRTGRAFVNSAVPGFPEVRGTAVSLGNPHLVLFDSPLDDAERLGPQLERADGFREGTNVEFAEVRGGRLKLRVWERGAGLTQACGTGACAAVAAAVHEKRLPGGTWIDVALPGGELRVRVEPDLSATEMRGPATFVFETMIALPGDA